MARIRVVGVVLVLTLTVALIATGIVVWARDASRARGFQQGVDLCVAAVAKRDPVAEARASLQKGDDRFFFLTTDGFNLTISASGVDKTVLGMGGDHNCVWDWAPVKAPLREGSFPPYTSKRGPLGCSDCTRELTACGIAVDRFTRAFNTEMARNNPDSIKKYCS